MKNSNENVMTGFEVAFMNAVRDLFNYDDSIREYIDNSLDARPTYISINIDTDENGKTVLKVQDNGCGMSYEQLSTYSNKVISHIENPNLVEKRIGIRGIGSKAAHIVLSKDDSLVTIETYDGNEKSVMKWNAGNADSITLPIIYKDNNLNNIKQGTTITIDGSINITDVQIKLLEERIAKIYSKFSKNVSIYVNDKKVKTYDPLYDKTFDWDNIECGIHLIKGCICLKRNYYVVDKGIKKYVPYYMLYMPDKKINYYCNPFKELKSELDSAQQCNSGVYAIYNNRYINNGGNLNAMLKKNSNSGAVGRTRVCVVVTDENASLYNIKSNKSNGIDNIVDNPNMYLMCDNKKTLFENIDEDYSLLRVLYANYEAKNEPLTEEKLETFLTKKTKEGENFVPEVQVDDKGCIIIEKEKIKKLSEETVIKNAHIEYKKEQDIDILLNGTDYDETNYDKPFIFNIISNKLYITLNMANVYANKYYSNNKDITEITRLFGCVYYEYLLNNNDEQKANCYIKTIAYSFFKSLI